MFQELSSFELLLLLMLAIVMLAALFRRRTAALLHSLQPQPEDASAVLAELFIIKPYLQLGDNPNLRNSEALEVRWHARQSQHRWEVQVKVSGNSLWSAPDEVKARELVIASIGEHHGFVCQIDGLRPGKLFDYRVLVDGKIAFSASAKARAGRNQPYRIAIAGDLGDPSLLHEQRVAHRMFRESPDMVAFSGDIVYERGLVSEYLLKHFPVYNNDVPSQETGAPLTRSVVVMPSAGNHDVGMPKPHYKRDFTETPDHLGYFLFWSTPLNGPAAKINDPNTPDVVGDVLGVDDFLEACDGRYPRMANYSFDWGNSHWLVLDSNAYMDWTDERLRRWVEADLAAAKNATWRFVMFHHPSFSSDGKHRNEQRMRLLAPILEAGLVDVVFTGHNHCYERTHPLRFKPDKLETKVHTEECAVDGTFSIDTEYDGVLKTSPHGVIYITDGAGGAKFYPWHKPEASKLKPYTARYDQEEHSFTVVSVDGRRAEFRQLGETGKVVDRFVIEK